MKDPKPNRVVSPAAAEIAPGKPIHRWSAARKRDVVLRLLRGESIEAISRQIGIEPHPLEQWRERTLAALDSALKERPEDDPLQAGLGASASGLASWAWRTSCCARSSPAWRAACLFTGRGRADERRDLACRGPLVRPAAGLPPVGSAALILLPRREPQPGAAAACTTRPGAAGRESEPVGRDQGGSRELAIPRRGAPHRSGPGCATGLGCGSGAIGCCG